MSAKDEARERAIKLVNTFCTCGGMSNPEIDLVKKAVGHLRAIRRAGPEFETAQRYSFSNPQDAEETERALELLELFLEDTP